jgi:DNA-binding transcriptional ArsR family regulator
MARPIRGGELVPDAALTQAAECLKVLAHPVRLRIVDILLRGDFCVGEVAALLGMPHHQACEHLRLMQGHGLLSSRRDGRQVYYQVANPQLPEIIRCIRRHCARG